MKTNSKKLCSLLLASSMALSMAVPAFAAERSYEKELELSIAQESAMEPYANRYDYVIVEGTEHLIKSVEKSEEELAIEANRRVAIDIIAAAAGAYLGGNFGTLVTPLATEAVMQAYGYGTAAKIETYSRKDIRYRIDSLTGKRTQTSTYTCVIIKLYVVDRSGNYVMYNTWMSRKEDKK